MGTNFKAVQNQIQSSEQTEEFQSSQKSNTILRTNGLLRPCQVRTNVELWMQWRSWEPVELQQTTLCAGHWESLLLTLCWKQYNINSQFYILYRYTYNRRQKNVAIFIPNVLTRNYNMQILCMPCDIKCFQKQIQIFMFSQALWPSKALHCVLNFAHPLQVTFGSKNEEIWN